MSNHILKSQRRKFHKGHYKIEHINTPPHAVEMPTPATYSRNYVNSINTAALNSYVEFWIPNSIIREVYLSFTSSVSTGNSEDYLGLNLIETVELFSGSNKIQEFSYYPVMEKILNSDQELRTKLLSLSGGSANTGASGNISPLPLFFSNLNNAHNKEFVQPVDLRGLDQQLKLRLKLRANAALIESGAGTVSLSDVRLNIISVDSDAPISTGDYHAVDYQTFPSFTVSTASETTLDLSGVRGNIRTFYFSDKLVSEVDANLRFNPQNDINTLYLRLDGVKINEANEIENAHQYETLLMNDFNVGTNDILEINFNFNKGSTASKTGHLNSEEFQKIETVVQHAGGADCYVDVVAETEVIVRRNKGHLEAVY